MPSYYLNFRFRFIGSRGTPTHLFPLSGRVDGDNGIRLGENDTIGFDDVHKVMDYGSRLILILKPYLALSGLISEQVHEGTSALLLYISDTRARDIKSAIDQHCSQLYVQRTEASMRAEGKQSLFRKINCPVCASHIDISTVFTPYIYCDYCDNIFDAYQQILPKSEGYGICPECHYYDRLQVYPEAHFYAFSGEQRFTFSQRYCCDTCARNLYERTIWKNALWLAGLPFNWYLKYKYSTNRNPAYAELAEANWLARQGDTAEADVLYSSILLRNENHPGIRYNYALSFVEAGEYKKAYVQLKKALEACYNYTPVRLVWNMYKDMQVQAE